MKNIIITLSITIIVFLATLFITNRYISSKSIEAADTMVMQKMDSFSSDFDYNLLTTKNAVYSFLTGNMIKKSDSNSDCLYITESNENFFKNDLQTYLLSFMKANPYYHDAAFIIEKDSTKPLSKDSYYAPIVSQERKELVDLAKMYDYSQSKSINKCKTTLKSFWTLPSQKSNMANKLVIFYVPICREKDGSFFGVFSLGLNISTIDKKIEKHLPYKNNASEMIIISDNNDIISSYPNAYKNFPSYIHLKETFKNKLRIVAIDTVKNRKVLNYEGKEYFQYERALKNAPWKIITSCCSSAVYAEANHLRNVLLLTSFTGMLLMLISCIIISIQIYHTHKKKAVAEQELNMASKVQMSLLREKDYNNSHTSLHAFINPAREAGGDLYDYAEADGKLVFCIGDVSGKGMPAALFMTQVVSLFRSAIKRSTEPSFIASSINDVLSENNPDMTFCTLFVGTISEGTLTYCNAGHNLPVFLSGATQTTDETGNNMSDNNTLLSDTKSNIAIGVMPDFPYESETRSFKQGDSLLLYTDGITEAKSKAQQYYGEERMLNVLSSRDNNDPELCTKLLVSSVSNFVNGAEQSDDITILCIKVMD